MARFLHRTSLPHNCNRAHCFLAFFWTSGILSGIWIGCSSGSYYASMMRSCLYGSVSIVRLVFVLFLPFLLSASAVFFSGRKLVYLIAFCKGIVFSMVSMGIFLCFGSAGGLIRLFLCFSELMTLPLLYWFWLRLLKEEHISAIPEVVLLLAPVFCIGTIDYCLILPFFADLIK